MSPIPPSLDWREDSTLLIGALYEKYELLNLVWEFILDQEKACPVGGGVTLLRDDRVKRIQAGETYTGEAGCWIRLNPVLNTHGSGKDSAYTDRDVATFRFLLLESDDLPVGIQLSLWSTLKLPIAALIDSGKRSVHAWLHVDCKTEAGFRETAKGIYKALACFRPCLNNKNPSRFARLPGVRRKLSREGQAEQRLLYVNPAPSGQPIFEN